MPWWKISNNTDSVDIDQKCIGMSVRRDTIPQDVAEHIYSNRGLHIQIRHNKDPQTFAQANELARLIAAAPDMLEMLIEVHDSEGCEGHYLPGRPCSLCILIARAEGRDK